MVGKIIAVSDLVIEILLNNDDKVIIKDILVANYKDREYRFEVVEISGFVAKAIALDSVIYLKKGIPLYKKNDSLDIEYSDQILGKVFDSYGNIISDDKLESIKKRSVYGRNISLSELSFTFLSLFYTPRPKKLNN